MAARLGVPVQLWRRRRRPTQPETFLCCASAAREATKYLDGDDFNGRIAAKQCEELRNKGPPRADIEKCAKCGVEVDHACYRDEPPRILGHSLHHHARPCTDLQ